MSMQTVRPLRSTALCIKSLLVEHMSRTYILDQRMTPGYWVFPDGVIYRLIIARVLQLQVFIQVALIRETLVGIITTLERAIVPLEIS